MRTRTSRATGALATGVIAVATFLSPVHAAQAAPAPAAASSGASSGAPSGPSCGTSTDTEYATGTTASAIGWAGNHEAVVACLSGSFVVKNTQKLYGYGIWDGSRTTWRNAEGYLPALVTGFRRDGAHVQITNFGDRVTVDGRDYVAIYSRVSVTNRTDHAVTVDPQPTPGLVPLGSASDRVAPGRTVHHDYAVFSDEFGASSPYPSDAQLQAAGGWAQHYRHMKAFWNAQLARIMQIRRLPDQRLVDAYRTGYIYTQITRAGSSLKTGVNGYDKEYSHDVVGILANMLTQGFRSDGTTTDLDLLMDLRDAVGAQAQYDDGIWKYPWPWAIYLQKTGNLAAVRANWDTPGPKGASLQPSIKDSAHAIAAARTGPGGIMEESNDIDANGYWTIDNYSALMGLAAYRWLARQVGDQTELAWADQEYDSLLAAVNRTLSNTISTYHLDYLPCSMVEPNDQNRCSDPTDANWAAPFLFGRWAWDGYLFGARIEGPGKDLIDATYDYGFDRLKGILPPNTYGGYGDTKYSTGYNAGYGEWGLASDRHRDQGILGYEFMIDRTQGGPYSWWESVAAPDPSSPWVGSHPSLGHGACPHAWGSADANLVLQSSLVAERGDGSLVVGRGVPDSWVRAARAIRLANVPVDRGHHLGLAIRTHGTVVRLRLTGDRPGGPVLFQLPAFVHNIAWASSGRVDEASGTVTAPASTRLLVVRMKRPMHR
ncbi:MAG TPA: hypothetical protein VI452_05600 [Marmoricola sp.]